MDLDLIQYRPHVHTLPDGTQLLITVWVGRTENGKTDLTLTIAERPSRFSSWGSPQPLEEK